MKYSAVILAAGKGVRMRSDLPKVAHRVAGKAMVSHVISAVYGAGIEKITMVVGHGRQVIQEILKDQNIRFVVQEEQLGTGHALMQAQEAVAEDEVIVVLAGDTPLLQASTIKALVDFHTSSQAVATVLTTTIDEPFGYGRVIRKADGSLSQIVEEKDALETEKQVKEINSGMYCFNRADAMAALGKVGTDNAQGEYYLTDILKILIADQKKVEVFKTDASEDIYGINDRVQLAKAEIIIRQRKNIELMKSGVTITDPGSIFIDSEVQVGKDTVILPFTLLEGATVIGEHCEIGPGTRITSSFVGDDVSIESSRIKEAKIGNACTIGPYAYLRPGTVLHNNVKVGDFVEIKKSIIGEKSKVPHLSYVGDATVGTGVNIGAGTITCNYDGVNKFETVLEDGVFIGSNTNLVAPVKIGRNSTTGAGSTITTDIPANTLGVERAKQRNIANWIRKKKEQPEKTE
ncbi:MAG: bifunctional UDP-N-acetylglucosamine diphosphorylase/glucosamine-1-phosphate N-acetyltransferase GlmU [Syntrophomonas sp.]